jgi:hypothetical protein
MCCMYCLVSVCQIFNADLGTWWLYRALEEVVEPPAEGGDRSSMTTPYGDIQRNFDNAYSMLQVLFIRHISRRNGVRRAENERRSPLINLYGPVLPVVLMDTFQSA